MCVEYTQAKVTMELHNSTNHRFKEIPYFILDANISFLFIEIYIFICLTLYIAYSLNVQLYLDVYMNWKY